MEKFGIFELLDALSALTSAQKDADDNPPDAPAEQTAAQDASPSPPAHGASGTEAEALSAFLARHDAISRRIKK